MRRLLVALGLAACLGQAAGGIAQDQALSVRSAFPVGQLTALADAHELRITFSSPMIALGEPDTTVPSWLSIEPAVPLNAYWSGSRTLVLSPVFPQGFTYGTKVAVTVAASARDITGRSLGRPFLFEFTTPTAALLSTRWYRREGRVTESVVLRLQFNQPMDPQRTLASLNAGSTAFRLADTWDEGQFPKDDSSVVVESTTTPPAGTTLTLTLREGLTGTEGTVGHQAQSAQVTLEPLFGVRRAGCGDNRNCAGGSLPIQLTRPVLRTALREAIRVVDVTNPDAPVTVERVATPEVSTDRQEYPTEHHSTSELGLPQQPPASRWRIEIADSLTAADGQRLGTNFVTTSTAINGWPHLGMNGQVWESSAGTTVPYLSHNITRVDERTVRMSAADVMPRLISLSMGRSTPPPPVAPQTRSLAEVPNLNETVGLDLGGIFGGGPTGLAWTRLSAAAVLPNTPDRPGGELLVDRLIQVTDLGITAKHGPLGTMVLVTSLTSAAPVSGATVIARDSANTEVWRATTGSDGVARAGALPRGSDPYGRGPQWVITVEKNADIAWIASDWSPWRRVPGPGAVAGERAGRALLRGALWTDRGVYQQGEVVQFKAMMRMDTATGQVSIPQGTRVEATLWDARGQQVATEMLTVNRWSSVEWTPRVPAGGSLGRYRVSVSEPEPTTTSRNDRLSVETSFLVAAFRRPDFRVDVTDESPEPLLGRTLRARIDAKYLFGAAVGDRPVRWTVRRQPNQVIPAAITQRFPQADYVFGYLKPPEERGRVNTEVRRTQSRLAADGTLRVDVPITDLDDSGTEITVEGSVENTSGQVIANRITVPWHPATFYVGLSRPSVFVDAARPLTTHVVATALDGTPRAGVDVRVQLLREDWEQQVPNGFQWRRVETPIRDWRVTTTADRVPVELQLPGGGRYILRATAPDAEGRSTRTDVAFYAYGGGPARWRSQGRDIDLIPEKTTWTPGEQARILVQSPWTEARALVTTEREGVRSYTQVEIRSTQDTVTVPVTSADIPNVFVSVLLVKGRTSGSPSATELDPGRPDYRIGYAMLSVDDAEKRLKVNVRADRDAYKPADPVNVSVEVHGAGGRPRSGEVSLWAVDHGLLSLTGYTLPDVVRQIYQDKPLMVSTADLRERLIERLSLTTGGGAGRGGGFAGGVVGGAIASPPPPGLGRWSLAESVTVSAAATMVDTAADDAANADVRSNFRPMAFWVGSLTTDTNGRAQTEATLPDSLTTYRIMAVAGTPDSHFGSGDTEIVASKPLTLVPVFPRFLAVANRASLGAVVTNSTGVAGTAEVTVASIGSGVVEIEGAATQTVRVDPGASVPVRFDVRARDAGTARLRIRVRLGSETDAFEMPVPVHLPVAPVTVAAYGDTGTGGREVLRMPADALPGRGGLTISLASTALVGLGGSALYLDTYPYNCAEPVASRALVQLLSARLGNVFAMAGDDPAAVRAAGVASLESLSQFQCGNGGFAMVNGYSCTASPYLTAYVLDVMRTGGALGASTDTQAINRAHQYLEQNLSQQPKDLQWWPSWAATQAYLLKVLAEGGRHRPKELAALLAVADRIPVFALSYVADALTAGGERSGRYQDIVRRIRNASRVDADRAFIEEHDEAALIWLWHSNVRATAVVLEGLTRRGDDGDLPPAMARWLLAQRRDARWNTTQENGVALRALVAYADRFEAETPDMTVTTAVGGARVGSTKFEGRSTDVTEFVLPLDRLGRAGTTTPLAIERSGTGRAYYTTRLQYVPSTLPVATSRGMRITREYLRVNDDSSTTPMTSFALGDLVRVVVRLQLAHEGRFVAITDAVPAGFDPVDGAFQTTAMDEARVATTQSSGGSWMQWWRRGGFDHVEKHDNRVVAFATRLSLGTHEVTYLARAMTPGTFDTVGSLAEAIYAPEITGRSGPTTIVVK
ncbi:MAG: alpha-2-macroglobulin family protein [Vicinamibacterales bacterium]